MQVFWFTAVAANFLTSVKPLILGLHRCKWGEKRKYKVFLSTKWHYASANVIKYFINQYSSHLPGWQTPRGYTRTILSAASPKSRTFIRTREQRKNNTKIIRAIRNILSRSRLVGSGHPLLWALWVFHIIYFLFKMHEEVWAEEEPQPPGGHPRHFSQEICSMFSLKKSNRLNRMICTTPWQCPCSQSALLVCPREQTQFQFGIGVPEEEEVSEFSLSHTPRGQL